LDGYISNQYLKVIKVHGSIDWVREVSNDFPDINRMDDLVRINRMIHLAPELQISGRFRMIRHLPPSAEQGKALYPAIAIPIEKKSEFECPIEHLNALRSCLPEVKKILVIGWRGSEKHFMKELREQIKHPLKSMIVSGKPEDAEEPRMNLETLGHSSFTISRGGFTELILGDELSNFLKA